MIEFSEWLQQQMDTRGWNSQEMARKAGVDASIISRILGGVRKPQPETLVSIAKALRLPPETVFRIANILPPKTEDPPDLAEWLGLFMSADDDQREEMLEYARFKVRQTERRKIRPAHNNQNS